MTRNAWTLCGLLLVSVLCTVWTTDAWAATKKTSTESKSKATQTKQTKAAKTAPKKAVKTNVQVKPRAKTKAPAAPAKEADDESAADSASAQGGVSSICIEADSGAVLSESNADAVKPPASMIKMALMLMVVEGLDQKKWTIDQPITVSAHAESMGGSQVALKTGESFPLEHMMHAIAVASANDAAMAVAEALWGSEDAYKQAANERFKQLGMTHTVMRSVHGLPPSRGEQGDETTARDMALLGRECVKHPKILEWSSIKSLQFRPEEFPHPSTNKLLWRMENCDGLKTGFTGAAGFCVTATAKRNDVRLISVVMGSPSKYGRFNLAAELIDKGVAQVERRKMFAAGDDLPQEIEVANFEPVRVKLSCAQDVWFCTTKSNWANVQYQITAPKPLRAPIKAGDHVADLEITLNGAVVAKAPLTVKTDLPEAGWRWKLIQGASAAPAAPPAG